MNYDALNRIWRLRVIKTQEEYDSALAVWQDYFSDPVPAQDLLGEDARDYGELLAMLLNRWEHEHEEGL